MMQTGLCFSVVIASVNVVAAIFSAQHSEVQLSSSRALQARQEFARQCKTDGTSGWKPKVQRDGSNKNRMFCRKHRLLPRLYVLGAPKCATTSFAFEMVGAGAQCAGSTKEYHFFTADVFTEVFNDPISISAIEKRWEVGLPECDKNTTALAADFTPEYLAFVRHPILHKDKNETELKPSLPEMLVSFYGKKLTPLMVFVVMLREPLARMQSWWYYRGYTKGFQKEANKNLERIRGDAWHSLYGWQLDQWTKTFEYKQFVVIPMKVFTTGDSKEICANLGKRLNFAMECHRMSENRLSKSNPSLADDTTVEFRAKFNLHFAEDKEMLLRVLVKGHVEGMTLAGFGTPSKCKSANCTDTDLGETITFLAGPKSGTLPHGVLKYEPAMRVEHTNHKYSQIKEWLETNW